MPTPSPGPGQSSGSYTEKTTRSYGNRIVGSIKGILVGAILFVGAFGLLFWNEGRVDLSKLAEQAERISAVEVNTGSNGKFVAANGLLKATQPIAGDDYFTGGDYLSVKKSVEVYAWVENSSSKTESKVGGSQETETTYSYATDWVSEPANSSQFKVPAGHENVNKTEQDSTTHSAGATVGAYGLNISSLSIPSYEPVSLTADNVTPFYKNKIVGKYIYPGDRGNKAPLVGDVRISYSAVPSNISATVFGLAQGSQIVRYTDDKGDSLYRAFKGSAGSAISQLKGEHKFMTWLLRGIGFLLMWIGLIMLFAPLIVLADVLPLLGKVTGGVVKLATFVMALVLSGVTILVSMLVHNIYAVIVSVLVVLVIMIVWLKKKKKGKKKKK